MMKNKNKPLVKTNSKADAKIVQKTDITTQKSSNDAITVTNDRKQKILIVAHNHPHFFPGGAEIIAYDLFKTMKAQAKLEPFFMAGVAADDRKVHTGTPFQTLSDAEDEILFWGADFDYFMQAQNIKSFMYLDFKMFLQKLRPDIIHFHHTMRVGIEALKIAREVLPNVKIVYTLHEYIFICNRDGQMVRKHNNELCSEYSPARCNQCFPEISPAEFKMREMFIKAHLQYVDMFISPSQFLADRFIAWGIPLAKMTVLENGRMVVEPAPFRPIEQGGKRNVFGYFGQINPYKGATLAFKAVEYLVKSGFKDFRLEIFGNVEQQSDEFKKDFFKFVDKYNAQVGFHGKYQNADMPRLIQMVDWVIVPSTWWENSPLVIQEAFMHKRPIITSDIGGMAEKVEHNVTGLHFQVRNEISLAARMREAALDNALWDRLMRNIQPRLTLEQCADKHYKIYDNISFK
jgi:glycosyltransferase involved in cell wall biosynthesis